MIPPFQSHPDYSGMLSNHSFQPLYLTTEKLILAITGYSAATKAKEFLRIMAESIAHNRFYVSVDCLSKLGYSRPTVWKLSL
ncbi:MAG: hypothetical protein KME22_11430 [Hassallia sp. WJT32-NPBG1]|nr:hypothetical protein [Hassallia sp. WJT32-NPBG1]